MRPPKLYFVPLLALLLVLGGLAAAVRCSQETDPGRPVTLSGSLHRILAIGGETTGWGLTLDKPIELEGKPVKRIDVHPGEQQLELWENRRVEATGYLARRQGVERTYWVLRLQRISPSHPPVPHK